MARPRHEPDAFQRRQVETLAGYGVPESEIASLLGIDAKTLRRHYRQELDHGHTKANVKVAENLFRKATGDGPQSVTAAIFWLKTRARWKEVSVHEHGGIDGRLIRQASDIRRIIITGVSPGDVQRRNGERSALPSPSGEPE